MLIELPNPRLTIRHAAHRLSLALQCVVNIGVRVVWFKLARWMLLGPRNRGNVESNRGREKKLLIYSERWRQLLQVEQSRLSRPSHTHSRLGDDQVCSPF
jgi:hypothetical protein